MPKKKIGALSTESYKGVRDFYPEDMAIREYIFDVWTRTAESFGFERYDASVLEPSELYRSKTSEEIVNEQTYTFLDRGAREVTLRPEMTPTVARMIAAKRRQLSFPVRWYSIPNLFRYERMQRGRLREHWQLNCDIFGSNEVIADIELIALASELLINFGATTEMFTIKINDRQAVRSGLASLGLTETSITDVTRLNDRKRKISESEYREALEKITNSASLSEAVIAFFDGFSGTNEVSEGLRALGINNVVFDPYLARGFDYYTGTIFEIFDTSSENNRSLLGGGRYDNLTALFGGEAVPGIGFGMGDVTMRDFLETHDLLTANITAPLLAIIPMETPHHIEAEKIAQALRREGIPVSVDFGTKKLGKKLAAAGEAFIQYALILGDTEIKEERYTLKNLESGEEYTGDLHELIHVMIPDHQH